MNFKLDENLGRRTPQLFRDAGHDVQTVQEEALSRASDLEIYRVCRIERRCLVTLDLDFSDVTRFSPRETDGIVVVRVPRNPSHSAASGRNRTYHHKGTKTRRSQRLCVLVSSW